MASPQVCKRFFCLVPELVIPNITRDHNDSLFSLFFVAEAAHFTTKEKSRHQNCDHLILQFSRNDPTTKRTRGVPVCSEHSCRSVLFFAVVSSLLDHFVEDCADPCLCTTCIPRCPQPPLPIVCIPSPRALEVKDTATSIVSSPPATISVLVISSVLGAESLT